MKKNSSLKKNVAKKNNNIYTVFGIIGDILFYPIIILSLLSCFVLLADKSTGKVPSLFGLSMVSISSGSMKKSGFNVKDIVFTHKVSSHELRAGDIITFYYYKDDVDDGKNTSTLTLIQSYDRDSSSDGDYNNGVKSEYYSETLQRLLLNEQKTTRKSVNELSETVDVYFHRIIAIYADNEGHLFFQTQGDSNASADSTLIAEDYVAGKYLYTPTFIRGVFAFISTSTGIIVTVVLPLSLLSLFMLFSIIEQVNKLFLEKKVLTRKIRYDEDDVLDANIGIEMDKYDKILYFALSDKKEQKQVFEFLWGYLMNGSLKDKEQYNQLKLVASKFQEDSEKYWKYFLSNEKKYNSNKIDKIKQKWYMEANVKALLVNKKKVADDEED